MPNAVNSFLTVTTVHEADVTWWWLDNTLHDLDYHIRMNDSVDKKVRELTAKYDVEQNTSYCCQWEGVQLLGADKAVVEAAGQELARHVMRFKGIQPLNL